MKPIENEWAAVQSEIIRLLETARTAAARTVNTIMTTTYWEIGRRIIEAEQQGNARADYGTRLLGNLSLVLTRRFGRGFSVRNLEQMRLFYLGWPIPQTASAKFDSHQNRFPLPWSAYVHLLSVQDPVARSFYETEALRNGWSVRQLDRQIQSRFYDRALRSKDQVALLEKSRVPQPGDTLSPEAALKDPFVLEFLGLKDEYSETDLEDALIGHLLEFLQELGDDFAFIARQRRLRLDDSWFRVDLVLFHRRLRCLVLVDLKTGPFDHGDAGQMHMYLNYARAHWTCEGENPPIGLILCTAKGREQAHYALDNLPNKVMAAEYQTALPTEQQWADTVTRTRKALEMRPGTREEPTEQESEPGT